jgi:hypothetical protein
MWCTTAMKTLGASILRCFTTHALAHVELQLPPPAVARHAPQLQHAGFGDDGLERDRHDVGGVLLGGQIDFHGRQFFQIVAEIFDQVAGLVVLAHGGGEEAELGGLADHQSEFAVGDAQVGAFLHAEGDHREGFERSGKAGHGGHGAFDGDVVGARDAAADAHAAALARESVISRAARDGVHQVFAAELLDGRQPSSASQEFSTLRIRSRIRPAFSTPPLNRIWVGQARPLGPRRTPPCSAVDACWRRNRARWRVMAASAA